MTIYFRKEKDIINHVTIQKEGVTHLTEMIWLERLLDRICSSINYLIELNVHLWGPSRKNDQLDFWLVDDEVNLTHRDSLQLQTYLLCAWHVEMDGRDIHTNSWRNIAMLFISSGLYKGVFSDMPEDSFIWCKIL